MNGEWLCYGGGQFNRGRMIIVAEVVTNLGRMVMLQRWTVLWRENGHVMEVVSLMEGARSC